MDRCYKQCVAENQRSPLNKDLDPVFLELVRQLCELPDTPLESLLLQRLESESKVSPFRYLHQLQEFMRYFDHPRVDAKRVIGVASQLQAELLAMRGFKDAVVKINQSLSLVEVIKKLVNLMRAPILHRTSESSPATSRQGGIVRAISREFELKEQTVRERLATIGYTDDALQKIPPEREPIIRRLFVRELNTTISSNNPPAKSVHMLEELDWLNRQNISKTQSNYEQQVSVLEHELASQLQAWNSSQPKYQLRQEKVQRLYQRILDALMADEQKNGLSAEVCSYLRKNNNFRKSILLNTIALTLWITKRKTSMNLLQNTLTLTEDELENCWKSISFIVMSPSMELPLSLKAFMFLHEQELMLVGRRLKDYFMMVGGLDESMDDPPRNYLARMQEHVYLRCHQFSQHFRHDLQNFLIFNLQALQFESNSGLDDMLFQATIDQFLLCCIYSGTLLRIGKSANFNEILSSYTSLTVKEEPVGWVAPQLTIIDYYNSHYLKFLRGQGETSSLLQRTPSDSYLIRWQFVEILTYLKS